MPEWQLPDKILKVTYSGRDPRALEDVLRGETDLKWEFGATQKGFDCHMEVVFVGDLWVARIATSSGCAVRREGAKQGRLQIDFVDQGVCRVSSDAGSTSVLQGQVHLSRSKLDYRSVLEEHTAQLLVGGRLQKYSRLVRVRDDPLQRFSKLAPTLPLSHPAARIIKGAAELLLSPGERHSIFETAPLGAAIVKEAILQTLICDWPHQDANNSGNRGPAPRNLRRAVEWINVHLSQKITLAEIASAAGTSARNLQEIFRRELGTSPIQYVIHTRLRHVHDELCDPTNDTAIASIATRYGFAHQSEFERHYRGLYGETPSKTRKSSRLDRKAV